MPFLSHSECAHNPSSYLFGVSASFLCAGHRPGAAGCPWLCAGHLFLFPSVVAAPSCWSSSSFLRRFFSRLCFVGLHRPVLRFVVSCCVHFYFRVVRLCSRVSALCPRADSSSSASFLYSGFSVYPLLCPSTSTFDAFRTLTLAAFMGNTGLPRSFYVLRPDLFILRFEASYCLHFHPLRASLLRRQSRWLVFTLSTRST
jgi:hypothetical protein